MAGNMTTESDSKYDSLEAMSTVDLLTNINREDETVAAAVKGSVASITRLVDAIHGAMSTKQGRLFYIGAGTSGRLGVVDASECPPTFGIDHGVVVGIIAGGDGAIRKAVEFAEDDYEQAWQDLLTFGIGPNDSVVGIAASGRTPYVMGGLREAKKLGCVTGCVVCNTGSAVADIAEFPVEVVVGPEFVTGSTRMKSGTAQKMVLNMISTSVMIKLGHVRGNKMVDMALSNEKLVSRGVQMTKQRLASELGENKASLILDQMSAQELEEYLLTQGSVRKAVEGLKNK
jgi:N-acetylmuramic acid 6-phosphate etherase